MQVTGKGPGGSLGPRRASLIKALRSRWARLGSLAAALRSKALRHPRLAALRSQAARHPWLSAIALAAAAFLIWLVVPPAPLFPGDYSLVVLDTKDRILRVYLSYDQQWRFPPSQDSLPRKYREALIAYEDKRFDGHFGVDPAALARAAWGHLARGRKAGGASTLTMQLIRLSHPEDRSYWNKATEMARALRLELHARKPDILRLYAAHAPMGGNVVGAESACWRYCGKPFSEITWAEAALFAVLPNSPSWIHPGKDRPRLKAKRDRLLRRLASDGRLDSLSLALALDEPLPDSAAALSRNDVVAPHFCEAVRLSGARGRAPTALDAHLQRRVEALAAYRTQLLGRQGIHNLAVLVAETQTGKVRAYIGSPDIGDAEHDGQVDGVRARRSTGSLLKPFLYARLLDRGPYLVSTRLFDVPTYYGSFVPQNASKTFDGMVGLDEALIRSLNVPAVRALSEYGLEDFYAFLKKAGLKGLFRPAEGYGLPLILGGAEASLWELTGMFAALGRGGVREPLTWGNTEVTGAGDTLFSAGAAAQIRAILERLQRPESEAYWRYFSDQVPVSWKTGTSFGQKDGWAIGTNAQWTIGVWAGNFSGEGNAALAGAPSAAPLLFLLFNELSDRAKPMRIPFPAWDVAAESTCAASGYPAGPWCPSKVKTLRPARAYVTRLCPYHRAYLVDRRTGLETCSRCWRGKDTMWVVREILPPSVRACLARAGRVADEAPAHDPKCPVYHGGGGVEIIYPVAGARLFVPRDLDGRFERVVFEAAHARADAALAWYLDGARLGDTRGDHKLSVDLAAGAHLLTVQDEEGRSAEVSFQAFRRAASADGGPPGPVP